MAILSITSTSVAVNPLKQSQPLGATLAFLGFKGMMPMLHGSPGCRSFTRNVLVEHLRELIPLSTTAMTEVATILGGEDKIEQNILALVQQNQPDMVGLCTTGLTETRGDDMARLLKDMRQTYPQLSAIPFVLASTPDFKGSLQDGFAAAVEAVVKEIPQNDGKLITNPKQVTVLASSAFTAGDIAHIKKIIKAFELEPILVPDLSSFLNVRIDDKPSGITANGTELGQLRKLGSSVFTIALGESIRGAAQILQQRFNINYEVFTELTGLEATDNFILSLAEISGNKVPEKYHRQRHQLLEAMLDTNFYFGCKQISLALEPDLLWSTVHFLQAMGAKVHAAVTSTRSPLLEKLPFASVTLGDLEDFEQLARGSDLLIANSYAGVIAKKLGIPLYRQGIPICDRFGNNYSTKVGYKGTMQILFDIANLLLERDSENTP